MLSWYARERWFISDSLLIDQDALRVLQPGTAEMTISLDLSNPEDATVGQKLHEVLGEKLADHVSVDRLWAREVLGISGAS